MIAFTALGIALGGEYVHAQPTTVVVPATAEWFDTGIDVQAGTLYLLTISASGNWTNVPGGQSVGPAGYGSLTLPNAVAPTEPFGSLIGRVDGTIFGIGSSFRKKSPASGRLFLSMNDVPGTYGDNTGQLTVVVTHKTSGVITTFDDPALTLNLLSPDPTPFFERPSFGWKLKNRTRPPVSGELRVLLDGALASVEPSLPSVSGLAPGSDLSGSVSLYTGTPPHLSPGDHTVTIELRAYTPDHELVAKGGASLTAVVPSPPPAITIAEFKATPDYQNQGSQSQLTWKFQPTSSCVPADLVLNKKDFGQPDVLVMQVPTPVTPGSKSVVVAGTSSPLRYTLSVACKYCGTCQTLAGTTGTAEVQVGFPPSPPPPTPYLVVNGPFYTPIQVRAKTPFSVSWTFENLGGAQLDSFDVELFLDGAKEGSSKTVGKLDAGKSASETWAITKDLASGIHQLELKRSGGSISFSQFEVIP